MKPEERIETTVPKNLGHQLEIMHIDWVLEELHERFGFPTATWKKLFKKFIEEYQSKQPYDLSEVGAFFRFGNTFINPILNQIPAKAGSIPYLE
jgi:hypothetical protein